MVTKETSKIRFETELFNIGSMTILRLPAEASAQLPSRGQTMVEGTINGYSIHTPLEPDGKWSHWLELDKPLLNGINAAAGDIVTVEIEPSKQWVEPTLPTDFTKAVAASPKASALLKEVTPMARWEWVRWIRSTNSQETRQRRVEVAISKLESGERRPCCWNRNLCTDPSVSKNGMLLEPAAAASTS